MTQRAPGSRCRCQMARSLSGCDAHECGGGGGGVSPATEPATTVTCVVRPSSSTASSRGMSWSHSIVKCGSTSLSRGREVQPDLEQLDRVGLVARRAAGTSREWTMPSPAVTHWTSPRPKRAAAPSESEWSIRPWRTKVIVSKPRWGCWGKPGHDLAVVHPPAVDAGEVLPEIASFERGGRAELVVAGRVGVEVVDAEQEGIDGRPLEVERHALEHGIGHPTRLRTAQGISTTRPNDCRLSM